MLTLLNNIPEFELVVSRIFKEAYPLSYGASQKIIYLGDTFSQIMGRIIEALYCFTYRTDFLRDAEIVLYSGFYSPLAVHHQRHGRRLYYCHTPPRYAYDLIESYRKRIPKPKPLRWVFDTGITWIQKQYESALTNMDLVISNSENVRHRLKKYFNINSEIIHPPIDISQFRWLDMGDYFISLARLTKNKRVDLIIQAFLKMPDKRLVVISGGSELDNLRRLSGSAQNIYFTNWQSDAQLTQWIGKAHAAIYIPIDEDFGMSPVEAMAAGKPVIGVAEGGLLETIVDGETGVLLPPDPTTEHIIEAVLQMTTQRVLEMRTACEARAQLFSKEIFLAKIRAAIESG